MNIYASIDFTCVQNTNLKFNLVLEVFLGTSSINFHKRLFAPPILTGVSVVGLPAKQTPHSWENFPLYFYTDTCYLVFDQFKCQK